MYDIGIGSWGTRAAVNLFAGHTLLTGSTRSGKSVTARGLLTAAAADSRVKVAGLDASGLLLAPWADRGAAVALGTQNPDESRELMARMVRTMDARIARLRETGMDKLPVAAMNSTTPLLLVVLEEWPALVGLGKVGKEILASAERIAREGAKAGVNLLVICQRPEKVALGGIREQLMTVVTHRQADPDSVKMCSEILAADAAMVRQIMTLDAGEAIVYDHSREPEWCMPDFVPYSKYRAAVLGAAS